MGGDLGQLARILFLLRFYYELPSYAHYSHSIAKALQVSQVIIINYIILYYILTI